MRTSLSPVVWRLLLALSLTLGAWPSVMAAPASDSEVASPVTATADLPPCHDDPAAGPEQAEPCCDGPCFASGCAPALCGVSQAATLPAMPCASASPAALPVGPPAAVPRTVPPPLCEPLRPPIA